MRRLFSWLNLMLFLMFTVNILSACNGSSGSSPASTEISVRPGEAEGTYWLRNPASGAELYNTVIKPGDQNGQPWPALVIIPGGDDDSSGLVAEGGIGQQAADQGFVAVAFDADGRGNSDGKENYNGHIHQDGLAAVIQFAAELPAVDAKRMGLISYSYGVTMASGTLARYPELPIRFFIDWEGPADRYDTTLGCKPSPNYDWPPCSDEEAWAEREAVTFISRVGVPYQRVQNQNDHAQSDVSHAVNMINAAVEGAPPWVRLNDYPPDQTYTPDNPPPMFSNQSGVSIDERLLGYAAEMLKNIDSEPDEPVTPVHVILAGHIEDVPIYTNCDVYPNYRQKLLAFADLIAESGADFNLQIDYEFFKGAATCETGAMQADTAGRNVIDYLAAQYGFEIDAHEEGGWEEGADNYADLRYFGETVTPSISENVGGLVWNDQDQFTRLSKGEYGRIYPDFMWKPQILTLAVSHDHHLGDFSMDDNASGIWKPKAAGKDFWTHDREGSLIYVGGGEHDNWDSESPGRSTPEFAEFLAEELQNGNLDQNKMYTAVIAIPQSVIFKPERYPEMQELLDELAPLIASGQAVYVTFSEAVEIWQREYGSRPNIFFAEGVDTPVEKAGL